MTEVLVLFMRISVLISQELMSDGLLVLILFSAVNEDLVGNIHRQFCSVTKRLYFVLEYTFRVLAYWAILGMAERGSRRQLPRNRR